MYRALGTSAFLAIALAMPVQDAVAQDPIGAILGGAAGAIIGGAVGGGRGAATVAVRPALVASSKLRRFMFVNVNALPRYDGGNCGKASKYCRPVTLISPLMT